MDGKEELAIGTGSPSKESAGTSIEVQTGNSTEVLSLREESVILPQRVQQKSRSQVLKLKVEQIKILVLWSLIYKSERVCVCVCV